MFLQVCGVIWITVYHYIWERLQDSSINWKSRIWSQDSTRSLSCQYPRTVMAGPQLCRQPCVCLHMVVRLFWTSLISTQHDVRQVAVVWWDIKSGAQNRTVCFVFVFCKLGWRQSWVLSFRYVFASLLGYWHRCWSYIFIMNATSV